MGTQVHFLLTALEVRACVHATVSAEALKVCWQVKDTIEVV